MYGVIHYIQDQDEQDALPSRGAQAYEKGGVAAVGRVGSTDMHLDASTKHVRGKGQEEGVKEALRAGRYPDARAGAGSVAGGRAGSVMRRVSARVRRGSDAQDQEDGVRRTACDDASRRRSTCLWTCALCGARRTAHVLRLGQNTSVLARAPCSPAGWIVTPMLARPDLPPARRAPAAGR